MFKIWFENLDNYSKKQYNEMIERIKKNYDLEIIPVIDRYENLPVCYDNSDNTIVAFNESGYCLTSVDAETLYLYLKNKFENNKNL